MLRRITSLTSFLSFILMLVTSIVLYFVPQGRVAYWADWHFLGLTKTDWGNIHITLGTLFVVMGFIHIWLNWKPIMTYMKNQARELVVFTKPMVVSALLTLFVTFGTLAGLPPMQQVLDFSEWLKDNGAQKYGNPPYGHAELSKLKTFAAHMGFDLTKGLASLKKAGITNKLAPATPIKDIAKANGVTPQRVFEVMRDGANPGGDPFSRLPNKPPQGLGKMSLADVCKTFGVPVDDAVARLKKKGFDASSDASLKQMAKAKGKQPIEVYKALKSQ